MHHAMPDGDDVGFASDNWCIARPAKRDCLRDGLLSSRALRQRFRGLVVPRHAHRALAVTVIVRPFQRRLEEQRGRLGLRIKQGDLLTARTAFKTRILRHVASVSAGAENGTMPDCTRLG